MSIIGSFDRTRHLAELNENLQTPSGNLTPAQRKALVAANLGLTSAFIFTQVTPATVPATATMTAAQLLTGLIIASTAAATSATLPLGADLEIALRAQKATALAVGDSFDFGVVVTGANAFTILTNTGWTLVGNMVVATAVSATFRVYRTAAGLFTIQKL